MDNLDAIRKLDHSFFWGEWQNTNAECRGMIRVVFADKEGMLSKRAFVNGDTGPVDLGEAEVEVLAENSDSTEGNKFAARYRFNFMEIKMHGWVKLGVLVFSVFNRYTDNSGRSSFFNREFFHVADKA